MNKTHGVGTLEFYWLHDHSQEQELGQKKKKKVPIVSEIQTGEEGD